MKKYPMLIVCGWSRQTYAKRMVTDLGCGVGSFNCLECGGDGDWSKFHPEPETLSEADKKCVNCKGTGKQYVNI